MPNGREPEQGEIIESRELGTFQLGRRVGKGGMGRVYEAFRPNLPDATFAVKFLSPALLQDEEALRRFSGEARRLSELRHRSIVRVHGYGLTRCGPCIVMDLLDGPSLSAYLKRLGDRVLDREIACRVLTEVLDGLHHVHEHGLVHRDIKADNIILITGHAEFAVKLVDFGVVKELASDRKTAGGLLVGTPSVSAPEQFNGSAIGFWTDIYQVGILAYRLLGGRHPFHVATRSGIAAIMRAHVFEDPPPLAQLAPDVPAYVVDAVMAMLRKEPAQRLVPGSDRPDGSAKAFRIPIRAYARQLESHTPAMNTTMHDQRLVQMVLSPPESLARAASAPQPQPPAPVWPPDPLAVSYGATMVDSAPPTMNPPPAFPSAVPVAPSAADFKSRAQSTMAIDGPAPAFALPPPPPSHPSVPVAAHLMATVRLPPRSELSADATGPPAAMHFSQGSTPSSPSLQSGPVTVARNRSATPLLIGAAAVLLLAAAGGTGAWIVHKRRAAHASSASSPSASELVAPPAAPPSAPAPASAQVP